MGVEEFAQIMRDCVRRLWDTAVLKAKAKQTLELTGRWETTQFAWKANLSYRDIAFADSYSSENLEDTPG